MKDPSRKPDELRRRAEEIALSVPRLPPGHGPTNEDLLATVHELRVHQIELEMQNEELRRAQRALEDSQARYFDLYELAPVGYLTLSDTGVITEANLTAARLLNMSRTLLVRQPLTRFIAPEDQDVYFLYRRRLLSMCELRLLKAAPLRDPTAPPTATAPPDPERVWVRLEAGGGSDVGTRPVLRAVMIDISERKQAEQTLKASEAHHRALFEQSRDALMTMAPPTWKFTAANAATLALFGAGDVVELNGRTLWDYSPERQPDGDNSADKMRDMLAAAVGARRSDVDTFAVGSWFFDWTFQRPAGGSFPATVLLTRLEIDGRPLLQATIRDETEVKRLQARLSQADRLASMGMVAAGVAHEINNPLAHVLYNVESLAQDIPRIAEVARRCASALLNQLGSGTFAEIAGPDGKVVLTAALDDAIDRAREALSSTQRIRTISRALGTFSRVESGELVDVDVNRAIESAISMASGEFKYRAKLIRNFNRIPTVRATEGKLSQLFLNLLINAAHALDGGSVDSQRITVSSWCESGDVFVEIADTGRGIDPADLVRIFEPFFTTKAAGEGSGLGLAICKSIVDEFGGDLRVESELGLGARFTVRLPVVAGSSAVISKPPELAPDPQHRGRILVVDDDWGIRETVKRLLGRDHDLVVLSSAEDARTLLETDRAFDVILCDVMMPRLTGVELHRWLAERAPALAWQVVFLTGGAFTPGAAEYLTSVGNPVLEKPFDAFRLRDLVAQLVAAAKTTVH